MEFSFFAAQLQFNAIFATIHGLGLFQLLILICIRLDFKEFGDLAWLSRRIILADWFAKEGMGTGPE